jgi:uncharacterized Fe-S cluster-containing radical SAM superfamily protein
MHSPFRNLANLRPLLKGRLPGQLIIQYSNHCNADCPQCGMRRSEQIHRSTLDQQRVKELIDTAAKNGIQSLSFTGGEPLIFLDDVVELTHYAATAGIPYVRTGTNGFMFRDSNSPGYLDRVKSIAEKLAATSIYTFWISIDSAEPDDHEAMRGLKGVIQGIEKAIPIFHEHGIYPSVNLGINRATGGRSRQPYLSEMDEQGFFAAFTDSFEKFYTMAMGLGFTIVNACYPMSDGTGDEHQAATGTIDTTVYGAASQDSVINFSRAEKALIFKALFTTIPKFRDKLRIFSPRCALYNLMRKFSGHDSVLFPCRGGVDFFFVECEKGTIHPCGYRTETHRDLPDLDQRLGTIIDCDLCEWECFRDPSDVLGPFAEIFTHPIKLAGKMFREPTFFKLLLEDLRYYKACGYFNGRLAPRFNAMQRFARP